MEWTFRADSAWNAESAIASYFQRIAEKLVVYEHPATGTKGVHCHGYMTTNTTAKSIRENILKYTGRKGYCKKPESMMRIMSYMSKGKYDPVFDKGIEIELIMNAKALGFDRADLVKKAGAEAATKTDQDEPKAIPREPKYLVSHLANECVAECVWIRNESLEYEYSTVKRVFNEVLRMSKVRSDERKFKGRLHDKFIREIAEHVLAWYFPGNVGDTLASGYWKYIHK